MAKWADYLISKVKFNSANTHIDKVYAHPDNDNTVGAGSDMSREKVVELLEGGVTFATIYKNSDGTWKLGAHVKIVNIDGVKYIKTYADGTKADNLDNLPRY